jgi:(S)-ureidoglycine aminohydrolase
MKVIIAVLFMASWLCTHAQTNELQSGVYSWSNSKDEKIGIVEKRQVLNGQTLDLQHFEIYTLTLSPGKTYIPPVTDESNEQLIVVKSGNIKLQLKDTAQTVSAGSIALVLADDKVSFQNQMATSATWYVINYKSVNPVNKQRGYGAGPSFIKNWDQLKVNISPKGEGRSLFDRATPLVERFEVHATTLNPGYASHDPHTHRVEELILMLTGDVQETIGQDKFNAHEGDCIYLQSEILHGPKNISNKQCYYLAIQWHNLKTD